MRIRDRYQQLSTIYLPASAQTNIAESSVLPAFAPWDSLPPNVEVHENWLESPKASLSPADLLQAFQSRFLNQPDDTTHAYTDGSVDPATGAVALAVTFPSSRKQEARRLQSGLSILVAELTAILIALRLAAESAFQSLTVFSDSQTALKLIKTGNSTTVRDILTETRLFQKVQFSWCPAHVGVPGNEEADQLAKQALAQPTCSPVPWPVSDLSRLDVLQLHQRWKNLWDAGDTGRLLHQLQPNPTTKIQPSSLDRLSSRVLAALRCRRIRLASIRHFLGLQTLPTCTSCQTEETVEHYLLHCTRHASQRSALQATTHDQERPFTLQTLLGQPRGRDPDDNIIRALLTFVQDTLGLREALTLS